MGMIRWIGGALLMIGSVACGAADSPMDSKGKLTLPLPRRPAANEMLVVKIRSAPSVGAPGSSSGRAIRKSRGPSSPLAFAPVKRPGCIPSPSRRAQSWTRKCRFASRFWKRGPRRASRPDSRGDRGCEARVYPCVQRPINASLDAGPRHGAAPVKAGRDADPYVPEDHARNPQSMPSRPSVCPHVSRAQRSLLGLQLINRRGRRKYGGTRPSYVG